VRQIDLANRFGSPVDSANRFGCKSIRQINSANRFGKSIRQIYRVDQFGKSIRQINSANRIPNQIFLSGMKTSYHPHQPSDLCLIIYIARHSVQIHTALKVPLFVESNTVTTPGLFWSLQFSCRWEVVVNCHKDLFGNVIPPANHWIVKTRINLANWCVKRIDLAIWFRQIKLSKGLIWKTVLSEKRKDLAIWFQQET